MVGTGGQVLVHSADHRGLVAPDDDRVEQPVTHRRHVVGGEAEPAHVVRVVRHRQIPSEPTASDVMGLGGVVGEDGGLFGKQQRAMAKHFTGTMTVLWRDKVRVGAARPVRRQLQHLRPERREHPRVGRDGLLGTVQRIEERRGGGQRPAISAGSVESISGA